MPHLSTVHMFSVLPFFPLSFNNPIIFLSTVSNLSHHLFFCEVMQKIFMSENMPSPFVLSVPNPSQYATGCFDAHQDLFICHLVIPVDV